MSKIFSKKIILLLFLSILFLIFGFLSLPKTVKADSEVCNHEGYIKIEEIAPTCETAGIGTYYKCPVCNQIFDGVSEREFLEINAENLDIDLVGNNLISLSSFDTLYHADEDWVNMDSTPNRSSFRIQYDEESGIFNVNGYFGENVMLIVPINATSFITPESIYGIYPRYAGGNFYSSPLSSETTCGWGTFGVIAVNHPDDLFKDDIRDERGKLISSPIIAYSGSNHPESSLVYQGFRDYADLYAYDVSNNKFGNFPMVDISYGWNGNKVRIGTYSEDTDWRYPYTFFDEEADRYAGTIGHTDASLYSAYMFPTVGENINTLVFQFIQGDFFMDYQFSLSLEEISEQNVLDYNNDRVQFLADYYNNELDKLNLINSLPYFHTFDDNYLVPSSSVENFIIPALGHDFFEVPYVAPTCNISGCLQHYICLNCNKCFNEDYEEVTEDSLLIPASHIYVWVEATNSCCNVGYNEHYHCDACEKDFDVNHNEITLTNCLSETVHNYGEWISETESQVGHYHCGCGLYFDADYHLLNSIYKTGNPVDSVGDADVGFGGGNSNNDLFIIASVLLTVIGLSIIIVVFMNIGKKPRTHKKR